MTVTDSISIEAPPTVAWEITRDVARWPEWTPTVTSVRLLGDGPLQLGSVALIKQPMQPESEWVVTEFSAPHRFVWETRRTGLRLKGVHDLAPLPGGTKSTLEVEARGLLAPLLWPLLRPAMKRAIAIENRGLKARCEQIAHR
jgi:uncharacterized membrane protein